MAPADFYDLPPDGPGLPGAEGGEPVKIVTLLENTACDRRFHAAHGLSLYIETPGHRILFDAGPNGDFAANAETLGVDLSQVDIAILSHGHSDHSDGLLAFFEKNSRAPVYVRAGAERGYYAKTGEGLSYIGLDPRLKAFRDRFIVTEGVCRIDRELTLFGAAGEFPTMDTSARLKEKTDGGELIPDVFAHEQDLLITAGGKAVLVAGCAHRGIVNIQRRAAELLGRQPDTVVGGFHLFQLDPEDPASDRLLGQIGQALLPGGAVYYTGHCTGEYPFRVLHGILGGRLQAISAGAVVEV